VAARSTDALPAPADPSANPDAAIDAAPVLDPGALDRLLGFAGGDAEFVVQLVDTFIEDAVGQLDRMAAAIASGSMPDLVLAAHSLKSNSANAGAAQLASICRALEADARDGLVPDAEARVAQARAAFDAARVALLAGREAS
jgi:HPt (histidine-containing phosphotransfer) domain-containing protein